MGRDLPDDSRPAVPFAVRPRIQPPLPPTLPVDAWVAQLNAVPTWQSQQLSKLFSHSQEAAHLGNHSHPKSQQTAGGHKQRFLAHLHRSIVPLQDLHHPVEANRCLLLGVAQPVLK